MADEDGKQNAGNDRHCWNVFFWNPKIQFKDLGNYHNRRDCDNRIPNVCMYDRKFHGHSPSGKLLTLSLLLWGTKQPNPFELWIYLLVFTESHKNLQMLLNF